MVACDQCDGWHHFNCVGVTADVSQKEWMCTRCEIKAKSQPESKHESDLGSRTSSERRKVLELQRLEVEKLLSEKRDRAYLDKKYQILKNESRCNDLVSKVSS